MIINGFGGGSVWSGTETLITTLTGSYTFTTGFGFNTMYDSASTSWASLLSSSTGGYESPSATIPLYNYFNLGYKGLKVIPEITSVSSGNIGTHHARSGVVYTTHNQVKFGIGYCYGLLTGYTESTPYINADEHEYTDITTINYNNRRILHDMSTFTSPDFTFTTSYNTGKMTNIPTSGYTKNSPYSYFSTFIHRCTIGNKSFYSPFALGASTPYARSDYLSFTYDCPIYLSYKILKSTGTATKNGTTSAYSGGDVQILTDNDSGWGISVTKPTISYSIKIYGLN